MPNLAHVFKALIPADAQLVGDITALNGDGTSTVTLLGSGTVRVLGESLAVNTRVLIRGQRVEGTAPVLTTVDEEV